MPAVPTDLPSPRTLNVLAVSASMGYPAMLSGDPAVEVARLGGR